MAGKSSRREYYTIGQAAEIIGVKPSVLRFWETEFDFLRPKKSKTGHRVYRPEDLKKISLVRQMLHEEGFTIAGARRRLEATRNTDQAELWAETTAARDILVALREDVAALAKTLE